MVSVGFAPLIRRHFPLMQSPSSLIQRPDAEVLPIDAEALLMAIAVVTLEQADAPRVLPVLTVLGVRRQST